MSSSEKIILDGWLSKKGGIVNTVYKRWFVLHPSCIVYYEDKSCQKQKGKWYFTSDSDVSQIGTEKKPYAFTISKLNSDILFRTSLTYRSLIIYADDQETRKLWVNTISDLFEEERGTVMSQESVDVKPDRSQSCIAFQDHPTNHIDFLENFEDNPEEEPPLLVSFRVIAARKLLSKGKSIPYVKLKIGNSLFQTKSGDMSLEGKVNWNEHFEKRISPYKERFIFIEVWDKNKTVGLQPVFLGQSIVHLSDYFHDISQNVTKKWIPLGRRSEKTHITGSIQIELFLIGTMDTGSSIDYSSLHLGNIHNYGIESRAGRILKLPLLHDQLDKQYPFSENIGQKRQNFYYGIKYLPSISTEYVEILFENVYMCSPVYADEVVIKGVFYKTNYRIVFIEDKLPTEKENARIRLFLQFPLGCIGSIDRLNTDSSTTFSLLKQTTKGLYNVLSIRGRTSFLYQFLFVESKLLTSVENNDLIKERSTGDKPTLKSPNERPTVGSLHPSLAKLPSFSSQNTIPESEEGLNDLFNDLFDSLNFYLVNPEMFSHRMAWIHMKSFKSIFPENIDLALLQEEQAEEEEDKNDDSIYYSRATGESLHGDFDLELAELQLDENENNSITTIEHKDTDDEQNKILQEVEGDSNLEGRKSVENSVDNDDLKRLSSKYKAAIQKSHIEESIKALSEDVNNAIFSTLLEDWNVDGLESEYFRLGLPDGRWRISTINENYDFSPTYPSLLVVPECLDDEQIKEAGKARSKARIPALVWKDYYNHTDATICRSSQPLVGLLNNSNQADIRLLQAIHISSSNLDTEENETSDEDENFGYYASWFDNLKMKEKYVIIDARPELNARANQAQGMGFESTKEYTEMSQIVFMDIGNIHVMRKAYDSVETLCTTKEINSEHFHKEIEATKWFSHLHKILAAGQFIADIVHNHGISVLIHCSDGWDRTSQLSSLAQILLDPYYRSVNGFQILVEKEWVRFGHKFADRLGFTNDGYNSKERSPIFFQWLDCIHQLVVQDPNAFQFNEHMLVVLATHLHSGWFGNFFYNNELERSKSLVNLHSISIWTLFKTNPVLFQNPNYLRKDYQNYSYSGIIQPIVSSKRLTLWYDYFFRNQDIIYRRGIKMKSQSTMFTEDTNYYSKLSLQRQNPTSSLILNHLAQAGF